MNSAILDANATESRGSANSVFPASPSRVGQHVAIGIATERSAANRPKDLPTLGHCSDSVGRTKTTCPSRVYHMLQWKATGALHPPGSKTHPAEQPAARRYTWLCASRAALRIAAVHSRTVCHTCPRAGWISMLLLEWLRNAVQPPGSRTSAAPVCQSAVKKKARYTCSWTGWLSSLLLERLRRAGTPPGSRTHLRPFTPQRTGPATLPEIVPAPSQVDQHVAIGILVLVATERSVTTRLNDLRLARLPRRPRCPEPGGQQLRRPVPEPGGSACCY